MRARTTRILYDITKIVTVLSGAIGAILLLISANMADFYIEVGEVVPGNRDMKIAFISFCIMLISVCGVYVIQNIDFSAMYDLRKIPLNYSKEIQKEMKCNKLFKLQVLDAIRSYYNENWGVIKDKYIYRNNDAVEEGIGKVYGAYVTDCGIIYIVANKNRSLVNIGFKKGSKQNG